MRSVETEFVQPRTAEDWREARGLIDEYAASLNLDLSFQDLAGELGRLREEYSPPTGMFLLAEAEGRLIGCVGLRRFSDGVGEVKRLYVRPSARGRGAGRRLAEAIIAEGRRLGYGRLLLDTLPSMNEAQRLYLSLGFMPIAPYRFNPVPGAAFLELELR